MGRSDVEDPKLAEVKAILARLQRMSPEDEPVAAPAVQVTVRREPPPVPVPERAVTTAAPALAPAAAMPPPRQSSIGLVVALLAGSASAALLLYSTHPLWLPAAPANTPVAAKTVAAPQAAVSPPEPVAAPQLTTRQSGVQPPAAAPQPVPVVVPPVAPPSTRSEPAPSAQDVLRRADGLIRTGKIADGRAELLRIETDRSADVAWALARAYDPNVVGSIENADAKPDAEEATRWYRLWHSIAIKQGLVADSISIERIIRSMKR